jgi:hypothetical protein
VVLASLVGMHAGCGCPGCVRPGQLCFEFLLIYSLIPGVSAKPGKLLDNELRARQRRLWPQRLQGFGFGLEMKHWVLGLHSIAHADNQDRTIELLTPPRQDIRRIPAVVEGPEI